MKSNLKHLLSRVMLMLVAVAGGGIFSSCDKSIADNPAVPTTVTVNTFMADGTTPLPVTTFKLVSVGTNNTYDLSAAIPEGGASTFSTEFLVNDYSNDWYFDAFAKGADGKSYTANLYYHPMRGQAQTLNVKLKETATPSDDDSDDTPTVTTAPTAITGIKAGEDKAIVTAGVADGGTMMYAVTNTNTQPTSTDGFSATVPKANALTAGTYYVWYYVKADATHVDSEISASGIEVTVAVAYTLLSAATASDVGKVVCAAGHLHTAKTAVPTGCTAVGILGRVTSTGHGLILALQDATTQSWETINGWASVTTYASTTLKLLPDNTARGSLASYTTLGTTTVSNWCVAQKSDYEAIFINLGSTIGTPKTYDDNVNAYLTTNVGGTAMVTGPGFPNPYYHLSATVGNTSNNGYGFYNNGWYDKVPSTFIHQVRPVLGF